VLREIAPGEIVYFETVDMARHTGYRFSLERWENGQLRSKLLSDRAVYDTVSGRMARARLYHGARSCRTMAGGHGRGKTQGLLAAPPERMHLPGADPERGACWTR
jgi:hypothetical protein